VVDCERRIGMAPGTWIGACALLGREAGLMIPGLS
jgi:hypothetical protein